MKFECPKCQSQLKYWEEFGYARERLVNKQTGKLNKKVRKSNEYDADTHGLTCTNGKCDFEYNGNFMANKECYPQLDSIFEKLIKRSSQ